MGAIIKRGTKDRPRFYVQFFDVDGVRKMKAAKGATNEKQARAMLNAIERRIYEGRIGVPQPVEPDPEQIRRNTITVREIGEKFTSTFSEPGIRNPEHYRTMAKTVLERRIYPTLGALAAAAVTQADIEALRDKLSTAGRTKKKPPTKAADKPTDDKPAELERVPYAAQSVTNTINTLSKLFEWARKKRLIDCPNPRRGVELHESESEEPITADKFLTRDEASTLVAYAQEQAIVGVSSWEGLMLPPMIATAVYAGLRKGELLGLHWSAIDFDRSQIEIARSYDGKTKSGRKRHVPLHTELAFMLRAWKRLCPKTDGALVFPILGNQDDMGESWQMLGLAEVMEAAEVKAPPKAWHGLRHTFASHFIMSGGNILTLQKLLGHADIKTTMIYAHLAPDFMLAEVSRMSFVAPKAASVADIAEARRKKILEQLERDPEALWAALREAKMFEEGRAARATASPAGPGTRR